MDINSEIYRVSRGSNPQQFTDSIGAAKQHIGDSTHY